MSDPFEEIAQLTMPDWDSYGAEPITGETVAAARILYGVLPEHLRTADIAPGGDGSIGFEWRKGGRIISLAVGPSSKIEAFVSDDAANVSVLNVDDAMAAAHWAAKALQ